jgi:uncharacterized protein (TIGR02145 family)
MYQWNEIMQYVKTEGAKGICPDDWHIPTYAELKSLGDLVNGNGNELKAIGQGSGGGAGTNTVGFSFLFSGYRDGMGNFGGSGAIGNVWSSTESGPENSYGLSLSGDVNNIDYHKGSKYDAYSVRCVKDFDDTSVKDYDGNIYQTIKIGNQVWMAENLRSLHYSDGTPINYYNYNNDTLNVKIYGRLYSSRAATRGTGSSNSNPSNVQGIAPKGWHLPSKAEWQQLADYLGGLNIAGGKMKESGTAHWASPNTGATNESGFNALPAGIYDFTKVFQWLSEYSCFSTSTFDLNMMEATAVRLQSSDAKMIFGDFHPDDAVSVRCIKDAASTYIKNNNSAPSGFNLYQNYPNPFNPSTIIKYELQSELHVKLDIINIIGQIVANPINERQNQGTHEYKFNSDSFAGGVYFYQLTSGANRSIKKMVILK